MSHCVRNPAEYDRLVTIEHLDPNQTADAGGHIQESNDANWKTFTTAYARITTKGGKEFWKINRVEDTVDIVFESPYSPLLNQASPEMRVKFRDGGNDRYANLVAVINVDMANREIQMQSKL